MAVTAFVVPKLRTVKTWFDKCLKSLVSEVPSRSNMVSVPKHCSNLHHSTLIRFIDHCQGNWVGKSLSYWHAKSWDCFLTYWLPIKSILFFIGTIQRYQFRCNYLRNKKFFIIFLLHFWNLFYILDILKKKKMTLTAFVFPKVHTLKRWLDNCLKSPLSEDPSTSNMVNVPRHCWNLHHSNFVTFIDLCQGNWVGKSLSYWHAKSWDTLLTHWLPIKSSLFLIETI